MLSRRRFMLTAAATAPALALHAQKPDAPETVLPPAILALKDRRKEIVPITVEERESRLDLARELMKQYKMDAIVITTGASLRYFTAASWGQSERLFAYVLPVAAAPFVVCPYFERDRLNELLTAFPERGSTVPFLWQEDENPFEILRRVLVEMEIVSGSLGIEEHTQFAFANAIALACPALKIVSATPVVAGCRSHKSPAEISLLRLANAITIDVYKAAYLSCGPGDTNQHFSDVVAKAYAWCGVNGNASCQVGENSAVPHGTSRPQTIRENEMVLIDDGCTVEGYTSDISRSFVYGKPSDFQREIFEIVHNAQSAALAAAHPGVEMQAVDAAARGVIAAAGYGPGFTYFTHRVGHGIGLDMHEWPYLVGRNTQKLAPGMLFSNEPGIYLPGKFGIRLEDDMLLTDIGAELLTAQSPSLQDPFGIAAVVPEKAKDAPATDANPAVSKPEEKLARPQKN
jgi:Xaa-Pro dipeptidase